MDLPLRTVEVWQFEGDMTPRVFLGGVELLLRPGDVILFGSYEPTEKSHNALKSTGAARHDHIDGFHMSFCANRGEHPNGCAFQYHLPERRFGHLLQFDDSTLSQKDIPSFYDHVLAFRPGTPLLPLFTFHDAAYGGTPCFSGHYSESDMLFIAVRLCRTATKTMNPILQNK